MMWAVFLGLGCCLVAPAFFGWLERKSAARERLRREQALWRNGGILNKAESGKRNFERGVL